MTGWFGYNNANGNEAGFRLDLVATWEIVRDSKHDAQYIFLTLTDGQEITVADAEDTEALEVILNRIEFTC